GGHGGHKGVQSIMESLGGADFVRLKIGIGRPREAMDVRDYVLEPFENVERTYLNGILSRTVEAVETVLTEGVEKAMNVFNVARLCEKMDS
ncbi:MAG: aminoacyl-tRNA hydrolase, partial [Proteobacteria bacterium]|nr:aminoacyl-tRNA hydrolase [Pseudomonadota bacterium]